MDMDGYFYLLLVCLLQASLFKRVCNLNVPQEMDTHPELHIHTHTYTHTHKYIHTHIYTHPDTHHIVCVCVHIMG